MHCADYISHYKTDAELFDYFEIKSGPDKDSAQRIQEAVFHKMKLRRSDVILDIGSGNGWLAFGAASQTSKIISCDISLKNLKKIKSLSPYNHTAIVCDAHRLPFRDSVFSHVVASEVLEHLNTPQEAVKEFFRVTKKNAHCVISTPYKEIIKTFLCIHCNRPTPLNAHLHSFDEAKLRNLFATGGWTDVKHSIIQNKAFITLRISNLLHFLPFSLWRFLDRLLIFIYPKAHTIIISAKK